MADEERKVALITGITGQDGSYLAEFLLNKGYEVWGIIRRSSSFNTQRIEHLYRDRHVKGVRFRLHYGDMSDSLSVVSIVTKVRPTEIYNLAAQSHVKVSFDMPEYTSNVDGLGVLRLLEAVRAAGLERTCRVYQASTSELYGKVVETPQKETTPFYPRSPYACAKLYGYWICVNYREAYNLFAVNGILFNHESPRRGKNFVTRKITQAVARISLGLQDVLYLGNLDAKRDWGHALDYVKGMWLMLQEDTPQDYVLATGETRSVREFCLRAFGALGIPLEFRGEGVEEVAFRTDVDPEVVVVKVDPKYFRPTEVDLLLGDPTKAEENLGWVREYSFQQLVEEMVQSDLKEIKETDPIILARQYGQRRNGDDEEEGE